ncbi:MAG TPA: TonB-dependent receptor [bacterium]|nr:TonB-dependent receptor [bacterium]
MKSQSLSLNILLILLLSSSLIAQTTTITGLVLDESTGRPIPDANVYLENKGIGAASGDGGFFALRNVPAGDQILVVSVLGYRKARLEVSVSGPLRRDVRLQPAAVRIDPVVITATRNERRQSRITAATDILTRSCLTDRPASTAGELVAGMVGLFTNNADHLAGVSTPSIRGAGTEHVLILMDDIPLNSAQGGGVDLNTIPAGALEQIEVLRGGRSALYGAGAVGGIIHLISRQAAFRDGISCGFESMIGSFGTRSASLNAGHRVGPLSWFLGYGETKSDGDFRFKIPDTGLIRTRGNNDSASKSLLFKGAYSPGIRHRFQAVFQRHDTRRGVAGQITYPTPAARRHETRTLVSLRGDHRWTERLGLVHQVYGETWDNRYRDPEGWVPEKDRHENTALGSEIRARYRVADSFEISAGAELRENRLNSTRFSRQNRRTIGAFAQAEINRRILPGLGVSLIPGIRHDRLSDIGKHTSPGFGLLLSLGGKEELILRANMGHAYRAPSFNDLWWPEDMFSRGNPDLKPETANTMDIGFSLRKSGAAWIGLESMFFTSRFRNLIQWGSEDGLVWSPENVGKARIHGIENTLTCRLPGDRFRLKIAYTRMQSTNETPGSPFRGKALIYRPRHKWDVSAGADWHDFSFQLSLRLVGDRYADAANTPGRKMDRISLWNAELGRDFKVNRFTLSLRLEAINLADRTVFLTEGYPGPGREIRLSAGFRY